MANLTDRTDKYYVAKVSKRNGTVEFLSVSEISGNISYRQDMQNGLNDARIANQVASYLNNIYEALGLEIYCYRVNSAESNVHAIANAPDEYKAIVRDFYGQAVEEPEEEPEEEEPEEEPEEEEEQTEGE